LFLAHPWAKIWGIKSNAMKPQTNLQISFAAIMISVLMLVPFNSSEAVSKSKKISFNTHQIQVADEGASKNGLNNDFTVPDGSKKDKNKQKGNENNKHQDHEQAKNRHHAEEEKHNNHLYHYHRIKAKKKIHVSLICICLKIIVAVSYISVLLCGYMSICH
jgi:hypothetical protein